MPGDGADPNPPIRLPRPGVCRVSQPRRVKLVVMDDEGISDAGGWKLQVCEMQLHVPTR